MSDLFDKSIRTLELPRVLELLSEQAVSAEARQRALRLRPETEPEEVLRLLDQTDAARNLIGLRGSPSFSGVKPVAEALDRADRGGALNTRELLTIADLLTAARRAKEYFNDEAAEKTAIDRPVPLPPRQPLSGGEDQAGHPGRGHHRRRRQHGAGGHPPPRYAGCRGY